MKTSGAKDKLTKSVQVWTVGTPFSIDPLECGTFIHHFCVRPILSSLVTQYRTGGITGIIAESWTSNEDMTSWRFLIRPGLEFDNGDPITSKIVERSLVRMAWLIKQRGSYTGIMEYLCGFQDLSSAADDLPGIQVDDMSITLSFDSPQPSVLENISAPLLAIAHPNDYDSNTGAWRDAQRAIASGPYRVEDWNEHEYILQLRSNFPSTLRHPNAPQEYKLLWDVNQRCHSDIVEGTSLNTDFKTKENFFAPSLSINAILYIQIYSWHLSSSPLHDHDFRVALRESFYQALTDHGIEVTRSFLPLSIPGIKCVPQQEVEKADLGTFKLSYFKGPTTSFGAKVFQALESGIATMGGYFVKVENPNWRNLRTHLDIDPSDYILDLTSTMTTISLDDPEEDIRLMVRAKETLCLPDPTGRINELVQDDKIDMQKFNEAVCDDAILWPITHMQHGLYIRKNKFDLSMLNFNPTTTDLSWIGLLEEEN